MQKRVGLTFFIWFNFFLVFPCGWDSDTIAMEKKIFPTVHELIIGKFLQHSQEFYYWRVNDRQEKIILHPDSLSLYDDLAWALNKVGEPQKGIEVMLEKEKIKPGLYKTYANLGTCYIHSKQYEKGLEYIKKAIVINPDAHFGREVYQQYLVEYVLSNRDSLGNFTLPLGTENKNFFHYLKKNHFKSSDKKEIAKAIKGIGGMMKFSNHNSPILLEALGDLLANAESGIDPGAGHLSSRAYLKAAFLSKDDKSIKKYKNKANEQRERVFAGFHNGRFMGKDDEKVHFEGHVVSLDDLEKILKLEIQTATLWVEEIRQNELLWIKEGINPDSAFTVNYYEEPIAKEITKYKARKDKDKIEEEYWLNRQLENPKEINSVYLLAKLPDSTKKWLDSIYQVEFSTLPKEIKEEKDNAIEQTPSDKQPVTNTVYLGGVILLLLIILARRYFFKNNKH